MRSTPPQGCGEGVQSLWKVVSKTCVHLSTDRVKSSSVVVTSCVQPSITHILSLLIPKDYPHPILQLQHLIKPTFTQYPHHLLLTPPNEI